jgi:hypothetical protein
MKPLTSADFDNDFAKERQFIELGAEQMLRPAPPHPLYFPEESPRETRDNELNRIQAENVRASNEQIN